jgi:hypothetical protein
MEAMFVVALVGLVFALAIGLAVVVRVVRAGRRWFGRAQDAVVTGRLRIMSVPPVATRPVARQRLALRADAARSRAVLADPLVIANTRAIAGWDEMAARVVADAELLDGRLAVLERESRAASRQSALDGLQPRIDQALADGEALRRAAYALALELPTGAGPGTDPSERSDYFLGLVSAVRELAPRPATAAANGSRRFRVMTGKHPVR